MKWVTRQNVGIDRMGWAWLIKKYIDSQAVFSFIPTGQRPLPEGMVAIKIPVNPYQMSLALGLCPVVIAPN